MKELIEQAARHGRVEVRMICPHCGQGKTDKTLCINTVKAVGKCHRCSWTLKGDPPEHFSRQAVRQIESDRLERQRRRFEIISRSLEPAKNKPPIQRYLASRGLDLPKTPHLSYGDKVRFYRNSGRFVETPAMIGKMQGPDDNIVGLHITHIGPEGRKAFGHDSRRYCKYADLRGSAIRLYPATHSLIVAEGIETALALHLIHGDPVWATTSASLLKAFEPPRYIERLIIAGDNDVNGVGQTAAWSLHHRFKNKIECSVLIPDKDNCDWLDMFVQGAV